MQQSSSGASSDRYAILVVDDEPLITRTLARVLGGWGHHVVSATTRDDALARFEVDEFDVVLADQNLAGDLGLELLDRIEELSEGRRTPALIVMSGELGSWPRPHLTKPFDFDGLRALLREQVRRSREG